MVVKYPLSQVGYVVRFVGALVLMAGLKYGLACTVAGGALVLVGTGLRAYGFFGRGGLDGRGRA